MVTELVIASSSELAMLFFILEALAIFPYEKLVVMEGVTSIDTPCLVLEADMHVRFTDRLVTLFHRLCHQHCPHEAPSIIMRLAGLNVALGNHFTRG